MITCQNCQKSFVVPAGQKEVLAKLNLSEPIYCPNCRQQQRLSWRNERILYKRQCDMCKKEIVSFYAKNKPYLQYCPDCWWSDKWQAPEFNYNPGRPFLDQFQELLLKTPHLALIISHGENSDYCPHSVYYKDCYMCISGVTGENLLYSYWLNKSYDSVDCAIAFELQNCYECVHCNNLFSSFFCSDCENSSDLTFCTDCISCQNCLGCVGLRHKENYLFNKPASKEQIAAAQQEAKSQPQKFAEKFNSFKISRPHLFANLRHCENSTGDYLYNCRDAKSCFEVEELENCGYLWNIPQGATMFWDGNYSPKAEMSYNSMSIVNSKYTTACVTCWDCSFAQYSFQCFYSQNLFGCAGQKHGQYRILNKQYSEEEYQKITAKIIAELKELGIYGEFFPIRLSPFHYNESIASEYFPLTREAVLAKGWFWQNELPGTFGRETLEQIPADIKQVTDDILKEILACNTCRKNYRIVAQELKFYRTNSLPLPQECFDCRHLRRLQQRNPRTLWDCACDKCTKNIKTTYSPDRPEKVYCEECYQKEIY